MCVCRYYIIVFINHGTINRSMREVEDSLRKAINRKHAGMHIIGRENGGLTGKRRNHQ